MEPSGVGDLFSCTLSLPPILEDELFYSWCARYHRLSSNTGARETSRQLFGHPSSALQTDFPTRLDTFIARTQGAIGDTQVIVFGHTKFPGFAPFIDANRRHQIVLSMRGHGSDYIKSALGVQTSRISIAHPLRACPECISQESTELHFAVWHVSHQLPGVFLCPNHSTPLWTLSSERRNQALRKAFILPGSVEKTDWVRPTALSDTHLEQLAKLIQWSQSTIVNSLSSTHFDDEVLIDCYLLRLLELGFISIDGRIRLKEICGEFAARYAPLANIPGLEFAGGSKQDLMSLTGSLLHKSVGVQHPLKHFLMLGLIFDSPEQFFNLYTSIEGTQSDLRRAPLKSSLLELRESLRRLVTEQHLSVNQAAHRGGISVTQAIKYLEQSETDIKRRPRVVGTDLETKLVSLLKLGEERDVIEQSLGLKKSFIRAYLAGHSELRNAWADARLIRRRNEYRRKFQAILDQFPSLPMKKIRRLPNNGFQWLYTNDRDWLSANLPSLWQRG